MSITLVFDLGNSTLGLSAFRDGKALFLDRLDYRNEELGRQVEKVLSARKIPLSAVEKGILGSVVPSQSERVAEIIGRILPAPLLLEGAVCSRKLNSFHFPSFLGVDRMANGVAAWSKFGKGCCIIDFGTATTLTVIDPEGRFSGGIITLGLKSAMECLVARGEQLRTGRDWTEGIPGTLLQKKTEEALSTGVFYGFIGSVEYYVEKMAKELSFKPYLIGTGGISGLVKHHLSCVDTWDEALTAEGFYRMGSL